MQIISVDALISLLVIKEEVEDPLVVQKIHKILAPREFTRLDEIVEILFSTAEEIKQEDRSEARRSTAVALGQATGIWAGQAV